jgi:hypothetical protein
MIKAPSYDEINKKLVKKLDPENGKEKKKLKCIKIIAKRFAIKHDIKLLDHIKWITKVGYKYEQGFYYTPIDNEQWLKTLKGTKKFVPDKKDNIVGCLASVVTDGLGIREVGKNMSLHCAVDVEKCSVHLDNTGFRIKGPFGFMYSLDGGQHVVYDLFWDDVLVKNAYNFNYEFGWLLDRVHPIFLNSKNKYSKYGAGLDLYESPNLNIKVDYTRSFDIAKGLERGRGFIKEFSRVKEHAVMFTAVKRFNFP